MGRLAASYNQERGTECVEGISNRRSNGRRSYQLVLRVKKRGQTIPPPPNRQLPVVNSLAPNTFRTCPRRANYCIRSRFTVAVAGTPRTTASAALRDRLR